MKSADYTQPWRGAVVSLFPCLSTVSKRVHAMMITLSRVEREKGFVLTMAMAMGVYIYSQRQQREIERLDDDENVASDGS